MKPLKFKLTQECGQKWYRASSWRGGIGFRKLGDYGIAFGPIMFFWRWS